MLSTERLRIYPASREQMEAMIASEQEEETQKSVFRYKGIAAALLSEASFYRKEK